MKILLDECLNWRLKEEFESHDIFTVLDMGWSGIINGQLLHNATQAGFQIFITIDKNLQYQLNMKNYNLAVVVLETRLNRIEYIRPLIPTLIRKLPEMVPGGVYIIE